MEQVWQVLWKLEEEGRPRFWARGLCADGRFLGILNYFDARGIWTSSCVLGKEDCAAALACLAELEGDGPARIGVVPEGVTWTRVARGPANRSTDLFYADYMTEPGVWPAAVSELIAILTPHFGEPRG